MWPFKRTDTNPDQAIAVLSPFVVMTLRGFELNAGEDLSARRLTECYVYGAVRYLASYDEMEAGSTRRLFEAMLAKHFSANETEIEACQAYLKGIPPGGDEQLFMIEGASALRRLLVNDDQSSGENLTMLLGKVLSRQ